MHARARRVTRRLGRCRRLASRCDFDYVDNTDHVDATHTPALRARPLPTRVSVSSRPWPTIGILALLVAAAAVRVYELSDQLVAIDEAHQVQHAVATRALYYSWMKSRLNPIRHVAERSAERHARVGPKVVEGLVAVGYMFAGAEDLRVPRALGSLFWLIGGGFLFALAASLLSPTAALFAAGFFLLVPGSIAASQTFTTDPLLIMLVIASWLAISHYDFIPSLGRAALAGAIAGVTLLLDPMVAPAILLPYALVVVRGMGVARVFANVETWIMGVLTLAPSVSYYLWDGSARSALLTQTAVDLRWELWLTPELWHVWRNQLFEVSRGPYAAGLAALGILFAPSNRARFVLWSLALGYLVFGLAFASRVATLEHTQLLALPLVGLGVASFAHRVWLLAPRLVRPPLRVATMLGVLALGYWTLREIQARAWPNTHDPRFAEIGELVRHSGQVIVLDPETRGAPLEYYGKLSGWDWPSSNETPEWRAELDGLVTDRGAQYFVSPRAETLNQRPEIALYLSERYALISSSPQYVVYDLRRPRAF